MKYSSYNNPLSNDVKKEIATVY